MEGLRDWLTAITAVCMMGVAARMFVPRGTMEKATGFILGLLLLLVTAGPLLKLGHLNPEEFLPEPMEEASWEGEEAHERYLEALGDHVRASTETYLEEKARELGLELQIRVTLREEDPPVPWAVTLTGSARAEEMDALSRVITRDLGIPPQRQEWRLYE